MISARDVAAARRERILSGLTRVSRDQGDRITRRTLAKARLNIGQGILPERSSTLKRTGVTAGSIRR